MQKICFNKKKLYTVIAVLLVVILAAGWFIVRIFTGDNIFDADVGAPERSVNLHNYNNWTNPTTTEEYNNLYKRDRVVMGESYALSAHLTPLAIKANNPKAKVYRYYSLASKSIWESDWNFGEPLDSTRLTMPVAYAEIEANDWWLRDANGDKVIELGTENEGNINFLDVGKAGFKEKYLSETLARMMDTGYDGIVFDFWWPTMISRWFTTYQLPVPDQYNVLKDADLTNDKNADALWFKNAWQPFIAYILNGLKKEGYEIIGNCAGENNTTNPMHAWQRTQVDGVIYEQGVVNWAHLGSGWLNGPTINQRIKAINGDKLNEVWVADGGLREKSNGVEISLLGQKRLASLAYYYLSIPTQTQAHHSYHHSYSGRPYWYPLWDFNIGTPIAESVQQEVSGVQKYAWSRKFSDGLVLLNYGETPASTEEITFALEGNYMDQTGTNYSQSVTLPAHTGLILKNAISISPLPNISPSLDASSIPVIESSPTKTPTKKSKAKTSPILSPTPTLTPTQAIVPEVVNEPDSDTVEAYENRDSIPPPEITYNIATPKTATPTPSPAIKYIALSDNNNKDTILRTDGVVKIYQSQPIIKGQTEPGATIEIKIEGNQNITKTVLADVNGNWQYKIEEDLGEGVYGIIIKIIKDGKILQSQKYNFEVVAGVEQKLSPSPTPLDETASKTAVKWWWYVLPIIVLIITIVVVVFIKKEKEAQKKGQM